MHYALMVVTNEKPSKADLENIMLPYREYEPGMGLERYLCEVDITEKVLAEYKKDGEGLSFASYCYEWSEFAIKGFGDDYRGYIELIDGTLNGAVRCVERRNPNGKWDWWVVGGRYSGWLLDLSGEYVSGPIQKKDISFELMRKRAKKEAQELWLLAHKLAGDLSDFKTWDDAVKMFPGSENQAINYYRNQRAVKALSQNDRFRFYSIEDFMMPLDDYEHNAVKKIASCYAYLHNGTWSDNDGRDANEWVDEFGSMFESLHPSRWITIIDYHS